MIFQLCFSSLILYSNVNAETGEKQSPLVVIIWGQGLLISDITRKWYRKYISSEMMILLIPGFFLKIYLYLSSHLFVIISLISIEDPDPRRYL